jgi:hypothetical protein
MARGTRLALQMRDVYNMLRRQRNRTDIIEHIRLATIMAFVAFFPVERLSPSKSYPFCGPEQMEVVQTV